MVILSNYKILFTEEARNRAIRDSVLRSYFLVRAFYLAYEQKKIHQIPISFR